jgi:hypothetical protein
MAIEFLCPSCHGTLSMADDAVGRVVRCGNCLTTLRVPAAAPPPPAPFEVMEVPRPKRPSPREKDASLGDLDEHGEPRPRRTRKKTGRSPLFWIFVVLFALGFFTCLACGGGTLILATPHWKTHASEKGNYTVEFPAQTNPNIARDAKLKLKGTEQVEGAVLAGRLEFYWVWFVDKAQMPAANDEDIIDGAIENMTKEGEGILLSQTPKQVEGATAREVVIAAAQGQTHHCLIVVGKSRVYVVAAGGPFVTPEGNPRIRRFLDSFRLSKDNPWRGKPDEK